MRKAHTLVTAMILLGVVIPCTTEDKPSEAEMVIEQLRAADSARKTLLKERQEWELESQRLKLLVSTVNRKTDRYKKQAEQDLKRVAEYGEKDRQLADLRDRFQAVSKVVDQLASELKKELDTIDTESIPGFIAPHSEAATDSAGRLAEGIVRLTRSRQRGRESAVELVSGLHKENEITVHLIRAGGAASWWISLDSKRAGTARREGDKLILSEAESKADAGEIIKAMEILKNRRSPEILILPGAGR